MVRLKILVGVLLGLVLVALLPTTLPAQSLQTQIAIAINRLTTGVTPFVRVRLAASSYLNWGAGTDAAGYGLRDNAGSIQVKNSGGAWATIAGGGGNPIDASYWTRVPETALTNETALSTLATALILNTTATGVPTAYAGTTCANQFVRALSAVGAATCASVIFATDTTGNVPVARGGTNLTSGTSGGVLTFTGATTITSSGALTADVIVVGGGAGAVPTSLAAGLGTTTTLLHGNAGGEPTWSNVTLSGGDVTGILPVGNGGTGMAFFAIAGPATSAKTFTFPNASSTVLTSNDTVTALQGGTGFASYAVGDLLYADTTTSLAKRADIATGNALISGGVGVAPSYGKIGLTTHVTGTLPATNGGTGLAAYTTGDLIYASSGTTLATRVAVVTGEVLASAGVATAPVYTATPLLTSLYLTAVPGTPLAGSLFMTGVAFASLATPTNGTMIFCTDCLYNSNPCSGASTGAMAKRVAGAWRCD